MLHAALLNKVEGIIVNASYKDGNGEERKLELINIKIDQSIWAWLVCKVRRDVDVKFRATCDDVRVDGITIIGNDGGFIPPIGYGDY
jgi:hypothetical protein